MRPVRSFMLSFLVARSAVTGEHFTQLHPGAWLIWEPGRWQPPQGKGSPATIGGSKIPGQPLKGDALCFQLRAKDGSATIRVGRLAEKNELVINDGRVSREHLVLECHGDDAWLMTPVREREVRVNGRAVPGGAPTLLKSGDALVLGTVRLTYYSPAGFLERLKSTAAAAPTTGRR